MPPFLMVKTLQKYNCSDIITLKFVDGQREMSEKQIILKWYYILFKDKYGGEFEKFLEGAKVNFNDIDRDNPTESMSKINDPALNLLYYLYRCQDIAEKYNALGIDYQIFSDTMYDLVTWEENYHRLSGAFGITEIYWLNNHITFNIFHLNRLQFVFDKAKYDSEKYNFKKGDAILAVHIPRRGKLDCDLCARSYSQAAEFFKKTFPDYKYKAITCNSWLLDYNLKSMLGENSNILKFQKDYDVILYDSNNSAIRFIFGDGVKGKSYDEYPADTDFMKKALEFLKSGGVFNAGYGILKTF